MKRILLSLLLAVLAACSLAPAAFAASDGDTQAFTIPVTLTVAHSSKHINVTLPAAMPVSVLDGKVLTADNLQIQNHSDSMSVRVAEIAVTDGKFAVASYDSFSDGGTDQIALQINGCSTVSSGPLRLSDTAFPLILPGGVLPIRYNAKVSSAGDAAGVNAANVIFTLKAE